MGYMGTSGTANVAPQHHSNSIGTPRWSGKNESEFTEALRCELRDFIRFEAKLKGNNDSVQDRIGENECFFHHEFLQGWPHQLWLECYEQGIKDHQARMNRKALYDRIN
ncbi:MAG: hypothetical protein V7749_00530 [Cocleimonas sp.]